MRKILMILGLLLVCVSCSNDDDDVIAAPNGQYRVVEKLCYCAFPDDGSIEYWIFDLPSNTLTVRIVDTEGELVEQRELFYGTKGANLVLGEGKEYVQNMTDGKLELVYVDNPGLADDELTVRLSLF
ncbi:MAG TPA: hypothetical protein VFD29_05790 [Gillisia sp.]|nr:hypothetical protein [Gillisia sp.]